MTGDHGTEAGYKRHYRNRTDYCVPCREAHAAYNRQLLASVTEAHGSADGISWHQRTRTPVCDLCLYYAVKTERDQARRYLREAS